MVGKNKPQCEHLTTPTPLHGDDSDIRWRRITLVTLGLQSQKDARTESQDVFATQGARANPRWRGGA